MTPAVLPEYLDHVIDIYKVLNPSKGSSEELYTLEEHESNLSSMSEQKKQGLSQLASMLELYVQQEAPNLAQEMTSALPPSCRDPLSLIAKVGLMHVNTIYACLFFAVKQDRAGVCYLCFNIRSELLKWKDKHLSAHAYVNENMPTSAQKTDRDKQLYCFLASLAAVAWTPTYVLDLLSIYSSLCLYLCANSQNNLRSYSLKPHQLPSLE
ncbi:hypothetical protein EXN66_Car001954 [Channa argus]|uniref:Uncharacterized protein n=1 Tax=Channa argus TaxID=215402 RepID=A0A6G1P7S5_CHAAH|nr:hypothetical protein EXN66_Car001954 [Channa argus]